MASLHYVSLGLGIATALLWTSGCSGDNGSTGSSVSTSQSSASATSGSGASTGEGGTGGMGQGGMGQGGMGQGGMGQGGASAYPPPPCGIFVLGSAKAGFNANQLRKYSFVDGLVLRLYWTDFSPTEGNYDFSDIDAALAAVTAAGQKLSIQFIGEDPDYVVTKATETWIWYDMNPNHAPSDCTDANGCNRPLPWDTYTLSNYEVMVKALAAHQVDTGSGPVALAEHPNVDVVQLGLPGWSRIRELFFDIETWPGYSRSKLLQATTKAFDIQVAAFPNKPLLVGLWDIQDGAMSPAFWEEMNSTLLGRYTSAAGSRLGYFQENLRHGIVMGVESYGPETSYAKSMAAAKDQTYIGLQMLTSWTNPFMGEDKVVGGNPYQAMSWANQTYGARYFEIYADDTDTAANGNTAWLDGLNAVHQSLGCTP